MVSPEEQALTRTYSILVDSLEYCAVRVTDSLFTKEMIPQSLRKKVSNDSSAVGDVIDCLIGRIKINPEEFVDVVEILMRYPTLATAVKKLKEQYAECGGTLHLPEPGANKPPEPKPLSLPEPAKPDKGQDGFNVLLLEKHAYGFSYLSVWLAVGFAVVGIVAIAMAFYYVPPLLFHLPHNQEPKEPQQASTEKLNVATALVHCFPLNIEIYESVSGSGIPFEYFTEKHSHVVKSKLSAQQFTSTVNDLAKSHGLTEEVRNAILDGWYAKVKIDPINVEVVRRFQFTRGGPSTVTYGHVATMKREDGTIDLAQAIHQADFKIEPEITYHKKMKRILGLVVGVKQWERRRERTLSESNKQYLHKFVQGRALAGFCGMFAAQVAGTCSTDSLV